MSVTISWNTPYPILQNPDLKYINIYQGTDENKLSSYEVIAKIDRWINNDLEKEIDTYTVENGTDNLFYFVRYSDEQNNLSKILLTNFELSPKELRWVENLRSMLDPIICSSILADGTMRPLSDSDLMLGIRMALDYFNNYSPVTDFTFANFPKGGGYEYLILMLSCYFALMSKFVGLSLRDFSYSDNGLSLNQSWGPAVKNAMDQIMAIINPLMQRSKIEFSDGLATGLGSTNWAVGVNGRMSTPPEIFNIINAIVTYK